MPSRKRREGDRYFMEYLFFDIECAAVFKETAKICAFGYCLCDEQFNIIEKEDVLIDPKGKFHLTDRKGEDGIVLPYDYSVFKTYPPFKSAYEKIRSLLEGKDRLVFGHATMNDVKYLNLETRRFHLPHFSYQFYDTQLLYMTTRKAFDRQYGLDTVLKDLSIELEGEMKMHRAVDDAYATMRIAEELSKAEGCSLKELLTRHGVVAGRTAGGRMTVGTTAAFEAYQEEKRIRKEQREAERLKFCTYVDKRRPKKKFLAHDKLFSGKTVSFARVIENDFSRAKGMIDALYRLGGTYSFRVETCDVYVGDDREDRRLQNALSLGKEVWSEEKYVSETEGAV